MDDRILVAYATKHGATGEIAEKIGQVLRQSGMSVDVLPARDVSDVAAYKAVVLGSALYIGRWLRDAAKFLEANEKALAERQVWVFSSGPTEEGDPVELLDGQRIPKALQPIADRIRPRDVTVFHGYNNVDKMSGLEKWMIKRVEAPMGDFRDWDAIASWAAGIASDVRHTETRSSPPA
jgi:menaquinone-dependent protoporphyrinogen oxidase